MMFKCRKLIRLERLSDGTKDKISALLWCGGMQISRHQAAAWSNCIIIIYSVKNMPCVCESSIFLHPLWDHLLPQFPIRLYSTLTILHPMTQYHSEALLLSMVFNLPFLESPFAPKRIGFCSKFNPFWRAVQKIRFKHLPYDGVGIIKLRDF